jgi:uncharacterized protein (AIM24 family)
MHWRPGCVSSGELAMSFMEAARVVHEHRCELEKMNDLGFEISGRIMQQLAISLAPGQRIATWKSAVIAHDHLISFEGAGHPALVMAACTGSVPARLVLSPGGQVGAFDLSAMAGRLLLPQDSFLAAGPGVRLSPYSHVRGLTSRRRPDGLQLMLAEGNGWLFSGGQGEVSELALTAGETLAVRGGSIAALSATVVVDSVVEGSIGAGSAAVMALLRGPGRVWLQSSVETQEVVTALSSRGTVAAQPRVERPVGLIARQAT